MTTQESSSQVVHGLHYATGDAVAVRITDGAIASVSPLQAGEEAAGRGKLPWIGPGLVDLQINGFRSKDFNTLPLSSDTVCEVTREVWQEGVTSYFPTVITNGDEAIAQAVRSIAEACRQDPVSAAGIGGIHLEGPFLSPEDGPRGAHDRRFTKAPDWDLFQSWQEAADGMIRIVTLSPEWPGTSAFVEQCAKSGVIVSIGHTAAEPAQIREAVSAGATLSTHFGNGAHLTLPRHPNYLWEQLAEDGLSTCVIADGFHLPSSVLKVVLRTKGRQAMLVSDAVHFSGMEPGDYVSHIGGQVTLTEEGRLHLTGNAKILAGSAQMLPWGISHLVKEELATLADAWEMASVRPAAFVGQPASQGMTAGAPADLVLMGQKDGRFQVQTVYKNGQKVWG